MKFPATIAVLAGPTASGKTGVSIHLAEMLNAEIINADSRQVYKGFDIGTAKPTVQERERITHHGVDICDAGDAYTAGRFFRDAREWMNDIHARGKNVLVVGGSGLYVRVLVKGIFEAPQIDDAIRSELLDRLANEGLDSLTEELKRRDPEITSHLDMRNPVRVLRALEVSIQAGRPFSSLWRERMPEIPYTSLFVCLWRERAMLRRRIDERVEHMMEAGFVEEVRALLAAGVDAECNAMRAVGYREVLAYISRLVPIDNVIERIQLNTWKYARRQMTWFRREQEAVCVEAGAHDDAALADMLIKRVFGPLRDISSKQQ